MRLNAQWVRGLARLPYVRADSSARVGALYDDIARMNRPVLNLYKILANQPPALSSFLEMSAYIRSKSSLDPVLRELAILTTAHALGQTYEVVQHTHEAQRVGIQPEKLDAVALGDTDAPFTAVERSVVRIAREAAERRSCAPEVFSELSSLLEPAEIIDLVLTIGWYHLCAVVLGTLEVDVEAGS